MGSKGEFSTPAFVSSNPFGLLNKKNKLPKEKKEKTPKLAGGALDARQHKKERDTPATKATVPEVPPIANGVVAAAPKVAEAAHQPRQSQVHRAKKDEDRKTDRHVPRTGVRGEPAKGGAGKGNWGDLDVTPEVASPAEGFADEAPEAAPPAALPGWGESDKTDAAAAKASEEEERKRVEDEEAKQMTLEEFRAAKAAEMLNSKKNIRTVDSTQFKNMKALSKPAAVDEFATNKAKDTKEKAPAAAPKKEAKAEPTKNNSELMASMFTMAPPVSEGRGRGGRGRGNFEGGRGRGRFEGGRGGGSRPHANNNEGPKLDDEALFPALPPKAEAAVDEAAAPATSS